MRSYLRFTDILHSQLILYVISMQFSTNFVNEISYTDVTNFHEGSGMISFDTHKSSCIIELEL